MSAAMISVDEFQALEQKVLQTVGMIRKEREARAAVEAEAARVKDHLTAAEGELTGVKEELAAAREELEARQVELAAAHEALAEMRGKVATAGEAQSEIESLHREREAVRLRVEKMLATMDEIG
jgi:uncharacterized protein involved in exopolysaccharide biosynthesis